MIFKRLFFSLFLGFCLVFSIIYVPVYAAEPMVPIKGNWKFQFGDNPHWSQVSLDDSNWPDRQVPGLVRQEHQQAINGWYRVHFDAEVDINEPQALLIESIRHSDETWLNGVRIGGEGKFEKPWQFIHTNPLELVRVYDIPAGFLRAKDNVLAIRTNIGFGQASGAMFPGGAGIQKGKVYIGDPQYLHRYKQQKTIETSSLDAIFITLGLVEIFIIFFLLRHAINLFPEYKWLLFTSLTMLLGSIGHDLFYINGLDFFRVNFFLMLALLLMPLSVALYFWSQYQNVNPRQIKVVVGLWAVSCLIMLIPGIPDNVKNYAWYCWMVLATLFFAYALYCALLGVYLKRVGAYTQLFGMVVFLVSIRTQWLPDVFWGHRNVQVGSLIYRYALLFAYFQKIKHMQVDYKKLSKKMVRIADDIYANVARELHDGIGQHLASMKLQAKLANLKSVNPHVENIDRELGDAVSEMRRLLQGLHPVLLDTNQLGSAIKIEAEQKEKLRGISISLKLENLSLKKDFEHQLFRIFQECLNNAIQHGKATRLSIELKPHNGKIYFTIKDNGQGFDTQQSSQVSSHNGLGLISLKERIALMNGLLCIKSKYHKGTTIIITFPLES